MAIIRFRSDENGYRNPYKFALKNVDLFGAFALS
jgi:hypothetical protein